MRRDDANNYDPTSDDPTSDDTTSDDTSCDEMPNENKENERTSALPPKLEKFQPLAADLKEVEFLTPLSDLPRNISVFLNGVSSKKKKSSKAQRPNISKRPQTAPARQQTALQLLREKRKQPAIDKKRSLSLLTGSSPFNTSILLTKEKSPLTTGIILSARKPAPTLPHQTASSLFNSRQPLSRLPSLNLASNGRPPSRRPRQLAAIHESKSDGTNRTTLGK